MYGAHGMDRGDPNLPAFADPICEQPLFGLYSVFRPQGGAIGAGGIGPRAANITARGMFEPSTYGPIPADGGVAWAGLAAMPKEKSRDVVDPGDSLYMYRQFSNGDVQITRSPRVNEVGRRLTQAGSNRAWTAITARIGDWATYRREQSTAIALAILKGGTAAAGTVTGLIRPKGKKGKKGKKGVARNDATIASLPASGEGLMKYLPWAVLGGGVLLIVALVMGKKGAAPTTKANPRGRTHYGAF